MKTAFLFVLLSGVVAIKSQTRFYYSFPDGNIDSSSYREVIHKSGLMITHDVNTNFRNDTSFNFRLIIKSDTIQGEFIDKDHPERQALVQLGIYRPDRKIVDLGLSLNGVLIPSAYVKNSRILSLDHRILGYIDGDVIYGVGLYLLNQ